MSSHFSLTDSIHWVARIDKIFCLTNKVLLRPSSVISTGECHIISFVGHSLMSLAPFPLPLPHPSLYLSRGSLYIWKKETMMDG